MPAPGTAGTGCEGETETGAVGGTGCAAAGDDEGDEYGDGEGGEGCLEVVVCGVEKGEGRKGKGEMSWVRAV